MVSVVGENDNDERWSEQEGRKQKQGIYAFKEPIHEATEITGKAAGLKT
jgi:hypothetical protein